MKDNQTPSARRVGNALYYDELEQGTQEWLEARCGVLTASNVKLILTPTLKVASSDKERTHLYELLAQRITGHVEQGPSTYAMERGHVDEMDACMVYAENCAGLRHCGFITNSKWGFTLGYSPDGLVGDDGLIECKSRDPKYQVQTILENVITDRNETVPPEYMMQLQAGLLVSERKWIDFISYSAGLPMVVIRVHPIAEIQNAIIEVAGAFEARIRHAQQRIANEIPEGARLFQTELPVVLEI